MPDQPILERAEDRVEEFAEKSGRLIRADRYVVVVVLLALTILANAFLAQGVWGFVVMLVMLLVTLLVTLATSDVGWRTVVVSGVVVAVSVGAGLAIGTLEHAGNAPLPYQLAVIAIGIIIAVVIARRISTHPRVSVDTVAGAAAIYLLFGLVFAVLYAFVGDILVAMHPVLASQAGGAVTPATAFFASGRTPMASDFMYFSFVTLTTVGYGDVTAATQFGRMLSVTEALLGQLYLVTVVAILVANIRGGAKKAEA